ncbi:MAG: T9SS type A sorting domain-containing protein [Bacteroidetes bacterium]|nr:T9SS type A sorting domain-containing protein [Bacteroidota bacterium]
MNKFYLLPVVFMGLCSFVVLKTYKSSGGHPSSTGAPGEKTCADALNACHNNASVAKDSTSLVNTLIFSQADSTYMPGNTYTLTLKAYKPGISRFGFQITALNKSDNKPAGDWVITDADRTHAITGDFNLPDRKYVTHSTNGTPAISSGLGQWSFNWKAPATNVGNITFYYASNCTNNDGSAGSDKIYLSSFTIKPSASATAQYLKKGSPLMVNLDAENHKLLISYHLLQPSNADITLTDMQGKMVFSHSVSGKKSGKIHETMPLPAGLAKGVYVATLSVHSEQKSVKLLIP